MNVNQTTKEKRESLRLVIQNFTCPTKKLNKKKVLVVFDTKLLDNSSILQLSIPVLILQPKLLA